MADEVIIVEAITEVVIEDDDVSVATLGFQGPQGPPGSNGATGATGPAGAPGSAPQAYEHAQSVPSSTWTINHNLGYRPNVYVEDTLGRDVVGDISHSSINTVVINFSSAFSGSAYLS